MIPRINNSVNFERLYYTFLYRESEIQFYDLYYDYQRFIYSVSECCKDIEYPLQYIADYSLDDNMFEDARNFNMEFLLKTISLEMIDEQELDNNDLDSELVYIQECFDELMFIEKNHMNSLEILFEAEEAEDDNLEEGDIISFLDDDTNEIEDSDYIDDPILLLKKIKEKNNDYIG